MSKSCRKCLYGIAAEIYGPEVRACSWIAATQLGRKTITHGPSWVKLAIQDGGVMPKNGGADCPAFEPSE